MKIPELRGEGWAQALAAVEPARLAAWQAICADIDNVCPAAQQIFHAFDQPFSGVRVVIVGQDPYPTPGHATGLAFAVPPGTTPLPPTLRNILQELRDDAHEQGWLRPDAPSAPAHASVPAAAEYRVCVAENLEAWARQGVLLLNTVLTCLPHQSLAHERCGWQAFTSAVLDALSSRQDSPVAVLWGRHAQRAASGRAWGAVVQSSHPSPLSAHRGFFGSRPFSAVNSHLTLLGRQPIQWVNLG